MPIRCPKIDHRSSPLDTSYLVTRIYRLLVTKGIDTSILSILTANNQQQGTGKVTGGEGPGERRDIAARPLAFRQSSVGGLISIIVRLGLRGYAYEQIIGIRHSLQSARLRLIANE